MINTNVIQGDKMALAHCSRSTVSLMKGVKRRLNCLKVEDEEVHSVDEQMILLKERISLKQYITNKPHKWAVVLCQADLCVQG